ncbi:hypothetical protein LCGC14_1122320, partial [marine sediment metagenome]
IENGKLVDRGEDWFNNELYLDSNGNLDPRYFYEHDGEYSLMNVFRSIIYTTGDQVTAFLQPSTYNFIQTLPYTPYFLEDWSKTSLLKSIEEMKFKDPSEYTSTDMEQAEIIRNGINTKLRSQMETKYRPTYIHYSDDYLGAIGSYSKQTLLKSFEILASDALGDIDYNDLNHRIYKITNVDLYPKSTLFDSHNILHRKYEDRVGETGDWGIGLWFKEMLQMFKDYANKAPGTVIPGSVEERIKNELVDGGQSVFQTGFTTNDFSHQDDIQLANDVFKKALKVFSPPIVKMMLKGEVIIHKGTIAFITHPWDAYINIINKLQQSNSLFESSPSSGQLTKYPGTTPQRFIISDLFLETSIELPTSLETSLSTLKISGIQFSTLFPEVILSTTINTLRLNQLVEYLFSGYTEMTSGQVSKTAQQQYNQIQKILEKILYDQIFLKYENLGLLEDLDSSEIFTLYSLARNCLLDLLKGIDGKGKNGKGGFGINFRYELKQFLASGIKSVTLDLNTNQRLNGVPIEFSQIELNQDIFNFYFADNAHELANSIPINIKVYAPSNPDQFLSDNLNSIILIRDFLKSITFQFGKIRIYGYGPRTITLGGNTEFLFAHPTSGSLQYYIAHDGITDPGIPNNKWYYEFDASDDFDHIDIKEFQVFLGALFADGQSFIIRAQDTSGNFMNRNEIIFAFNAYQDLLPENFVGPKLITSTKYAYPSFQNEHLIAQNNVYYNQLTVQWRAILAQLNENNRVHQPRYIWDWIQACIRIGIDENFF